MRVRRAAIQRRAMLEPVVAAAAAEAAAGAGERWTAWRSELAKDWGQRFRQMRSKGVAPLRGIRPGRYSRFSDWRRLRRQRLKGLEPPNSLVIAKTNRWS